MRIIGPPYYKPEVICDRPPFPSEGMRKSRLADDLRIRSETARRKREARLRCPDCGGSMKVRLGRRWLCHHCLVRMIVPL